MPGYISADIICSENRTELLETVNYGEQMMSKDKYPSIFFVTRVELKIGQYHSDIPQF